MQLFLLLVLFSFSFFSVLFASEKDHSEILIERLGDCYKVAEGTFGRGFSGSGNLYYEEFSPSGDTYNNDFKKTERLFKTNVDRLVKQFCQNTYDVSKDDKNIVTKCVGNPGGANGFIKEENKFFARIQYIDCDLQKIRIVSKETENETPFQ